MKDKAKQFVFTPGPWHGKTYWDGSFVVTGGHATDTGSCVIASRHAIEFKADESIGNGKLIAAAPEMFRACGLLMEFARQDGDAVQLLDEAIDAARDALDKIVGETK